MKRTRNRRRRRNKTRHKRLRRGGCADINNGEYTEDRAETIKASNGGKERCVYTRNSNMGNQIRYILVNNAMKIYTPN